MECIVFFFLQVKSKKLFIFFPEMPYLRSFFPIFFIFSSFFIFLTACSVEENDSISPSSSGVIFTDSWEEPLFSWMLLSTEEVESIRAKYAGGASRIFIPYAIFGADISNRYDIDISFVYSAYIPYEPYFDELGRNDNTIFQLINTIKERQISFYNTLFQKEITPEIIATTSGKYTCLEMRGSVKKTQGILWLHTEISAISDIPVDSTLLSEQFPLGSPASPWWVTVRTSTWRIFQEWRLITDEENIFFHTIAFLPTWYISFWENGYFIHSVTRDNYGKPYTYAQDEKTILAEEEPLYPLSMKDCTIKNENLLNHFVIEFLPSEIQAWSGQTQADYRPFVNRFTLWLPAWSWALQYALFTMNSWKVMEIPVFSQWDAVARWQIRCMSDGSCAITFDSETLSQILSLELFYDAEK